MAISSAAVAGRSRRWASGSTRRSRASHPGRHLARHRTRGATEPVCGMTVDRGKAATKQLDGRTLYCCSEHCLHASETDPQRYLDQNSRPDTNAIQKRWSLNAPIAARALSRSITCKTSSPKSQARGCGVARARPWTLWTRRDRERAARRPSGQTRVQPRGGKQDLVRRERTLRS
jgi:YHS domain-containing protein